ncbi:Retrovirus-related Pol polyprotein from type-2 retrotransposable element R2DM; Endonuclease [Eumeta japonica]|uniref:Retrovirus-related Pol polyprotein from type-2 retrotransposable element R2DM Endonuclease n=1 Tax=Eumeta variegata TaxID=151549 RepID=A0A4C1XYQ4_EUMVA|nr:Retrovirus-related Pol polyprotein from type-2 retrotransposable element R2DM; Endonuclease [Eumeta japonica]
MAFIDYTKAFDSISHEEIWDSLKYQGIPTVYINIIKSIYAKNKARIKLESLGETFKIERGVRQGDSLSPKLFSAVLENVFQKLHWNHYGLDIDGRKLNHLRFADDIILFEENPSKLQIVIEELNNENWYPRDGKRKRGRQHRRWEDELKLTTGPKWRRVARDRKQWKMLEEAFANRHTELRDILTALAEAELEYDPQYKSTEVYVEFPLHKLPQKFQEYANR